MKSRLQRSLFDDEDIPTEDRADHPRTPSAPSGMGAVQANSPPKIHPAVRLTKEQWANCKKLDDCEWVAFLREHGRVPLLSDTKKPWEYPGWLMYYRILLEDHIDIPRRWDYWFRTMAAGRLLDEPIPQICFTAGGGERSEGYKLIDQWVRLIDRYGGGWSSPMPVLLDWLLWGFGLSGEKPSLKPDLDEQLYRAVNLVPLLLEPHDYFGEWIADQKGKWNVHAFFPTPEHVVEMMVQINFSGVDPMNARSMTVCEPCMGTGRMLILSSNFSLRLFGMDIDNEVLRAAKVNGALYAPWLVRPFPEHFFAECEISSPTKKSTNVVARTKASVRHGRKQNA